jgi:hypothetical protein
MTTQDMHNRAILVSLRISSWSAKKFDKQVSADAAAAHGASPEAGRYNKSLLPSTVSCAVSSKKSRSKTEQANSYKTLMTFIAAVRVWHYEQTLAWSDDGWRMLPIKNYQAYTDGIRTRQHEFNSLLSDFTRDYPALREDARRVLNGMFNESEYPSDVRSRFGFGLEFAPVPTGSDFRVALSDVEIQAISANTESRVAGAFEAAHKDAVKRLYEALEKMQTRLANPEGIFRDTLVQNARDLCDILTRLNVTDDSKLDGFRRQTELLAASTEAQTLRDAPDVRIDTANRAQSILDAMTQTYGNNLFGGKK